MKGIELKEYENKRNIMKLEDEVAEFQRRDMVEEEEEEVVEVEEGVEVKEVVAASKK